MHVHAWVSVRKRGISFQSTSICYTYVCVCVCVCERERERERGGGRESVLVGCCEENPRSLHQQDLNPHWECPVSKKFK